MGLSLAYAHAFWRSDLMVVKETWWMGSILWTLRQLKYLFSACDSILIKILFNDIFLNSKRKSWMRRNWPCLKTFEVKLLRWSWLLKTGLRVDGGNQSFLSPLTLSLPHFLSLPHSNALIPLFFQSKLLCQASIPISYIVPCHVAI